MHSHLPVVIMLAATLLSAPACADWVWTPERGWHNPKNETRGSADQIYARGIRLYENGQYLEAAKVFDDLSRGFAGSKFAKRAQFYAGESYFEAGRLFEAYESYEAYLRDYPESGEIDIIVEKEYEIGRAFLNGARKKTFNLNFLALPSPKTGIRMLESVIEHSPFSDFADDSVYAIAEFYFRNARYTLAAEQYRRLFREYPDSEWATKSRYQAAICSERQVEGSEYSSENLVRAREQLEEYSARHESAPGGLSVVGQIAAIDESLAQKLWDEVGYYTRVGKKFSAAYLCRRLQTEYPKTSYAALAEQWIGENPETMLRAEAGDPEEDELKGDSSSTVRATPASTSGAPPVTLAPAPTTAPAYAPPPPSGATPSASQPAPAAVPAAGPAPSGRFVPRSHSSSGSK